MERIGRRLEWPTARWVRPIPGAREKEAGKWDPGRPYLYPTQVPLGEKPKVFRDTPG